MKKIFSYALLLLSGALALTSCSDDNDSNPILVTPKAGSFVLNQPVLSGSTVDLEKSSAITLSWSQPQFTTPNAPVNVTYTIEVSTTGQFAKQYSDAEDADNTGVDYMVLDGSVNVCSNNVSAADINKALQIISEWDETTVPSEAVAYIRAHAAVIDASFVTRSEIYSNIVKLTVDPYYIELKNADPVLWWLIGSDICDGSWGGDVAKCVIPLQVVDGYDYDKKTGQGEVSWTGYLAGNGFKLRGDMNDGWATQFGQGDAFGTFVKNDGGSSNITVPSAGYYTVTLNTATDVLKVEPYAETPKTFTSICVSGGMNEWGDTEMTPAFSFTGAVNHDWYITMTFDGATKFKFKEAGSWDYNTGGALNTMNTGDAWGYGTNNGPDILPEAGTYLIIYNDITRYYRLIKQ